jgi:hypothetical protein
MKEQITLTNCLIELKETSSNFTEFLIKNYEKELLINGCKYTDSILFVTDKNKLKLFLLNERKKLNSLKAVKPKILTVDNSSSTPKQSSVLTSFRAGIDFKRRFKLTDSEFFVIGEFINLTRGGLENKITINQTELGKSVSISNKNITKVLNKLIDKDLLIKFNPENGSRFNKYSLNLEKITALKSRRI